MEIIPYEAGHFDSIVQLSLRAWAPVFEALQQAMNPEVYQAFYPEGWQLSQQQSVAETCTSGEARVWVAQESGVVVGFVAVKHHQEDKLGEIYMIAVDPEFQHRGIGAALTDFALDWMKGVGIAVAMVETGGDPGHAPARRTYEKMGFGLLPIARYFKKL